MAMKHSDIVSLVLHGVALPLVTAVVNSYDGKDEQKAVDNVSDLLTKASETVRAIDSDSALSEKPLSDLNDRMDLLATCCHILADDYMQNDSLPTEGEMKKHVDCINALLLSRHTAIDAETKYDNGLRLAYLEGYAPLIKAVHGFSFGQAENKMIQSVSQHIEDAADDITQKVYGSNSQSLAKHHIRSALIALYAACHKKEVHRITGLQEHERDSESNDKQVKRIWTDFELHKDMISVIAETMRAENIPKRDDIDIDQAVFEELLEHTDLDDFAPVDFYQDVSNDDSDDGKGDQESPMTFFKVK